MRLIVFAIAALVLSSCKQPKKAMTVAYLNKDFLFNKDSVRGFLLRVNDAQADSGKAVFLKGIGLLKNGNNATKAIALLQQSLSIYPTANAYYELGNAYLQTKEWPAALSAFELAEGMNFTPLGSALFGQASCYAEMDSTDKMYSYLTYAVQTGFVDRQKVLNNPHFAAYKNNSDIASTYNQAMGGNGNPDEILWQGYTQEFKQASFPFKVDSGSYGMMSEPQIISYDYEGYVPEMRDGKFSRDVGSEYFYVSKIMQTELCSVVLYGCRSYEEEGAPVYYILASFNNKGKLVDKMIAGGAKTFDENYKEFMAQGANHFQIQEYKNSYEKSTDENGFENNKVTSRELVATRTYSIDKTGKFIAG